MVVISMYRGNMHRVPAVVRRWPMPRRVISVGDFERLNRRRAAAIAALLHVADKPFLHEQRNLVEEENVGEEGVAGRRESAPPALVTVDSNSLRDGELEAQKPPNDSTEKDGGGDPDAPRDPKVSEASPSTADSDERAYVFSRAPDTDVARTNSADEKLQLPIRDGLHREGNPTDRFEFKFDEGGFLAVMDSGGHRGARFAIGAAAEVGDGTGTVVRQGTVMDDEMCTSFDDLSGKSSRCRWSSTSRSDRLRRPLLLAVAVVHDGTPPSPTGRPSRGPSTIAGGTLPATHLSLFTQKGKKGAIQDAMIVWDVHASSRRLLGGTSFDTGLRS